jgi:hypothetical protein
LLNIVLRRDKLSTLRLSRYNFFQLGCGPEANALSIVAIHGLYEDELQTWTDSASKVLWLRDLLPHRLHHFRALAYSYKVAKFTSPGTDTTNSALGDAQNLVAELYADREFCDAFDRPIIFICHGFGGLLVKRALAFSNSRDGKAVEHLRSIYTCTYGILFLGTPHNGINKSTLLSQSLQNPGPSQFTLGLLEGSEMLNEINDQFAPLMKQFSIYNFWEELETDYGTHKSFVVDPDSAAPPAWDNVEKCGITAMHSTMTKFVRHSDRKFQPILEALSRYARYAPAMIESRWRMSAELMDKKRQNEVEELLHPRRDSLLQADLTPQDYNQWCLIPRKPSTFFTGRQKHATNAKDMLGSILKHNNHSRTRALVIYGLGGSGKTQFCLKYVENNKHRYVAHDLARVASVC